MEYYEWSDVFKLPFYNYHGVVFDANHLLIGEFLHADEELQKSVIDTLNGNRKTNFFVYSAYDEIVDSVTESTILSILAFNYLIKSEGLNLGGIMARNIIESLSEFIENKLNGI